MIRLASQRTGHVKRTADQAPWSLAAAIILSACNQAPRAVQAVTVNDSAGIRIIEVSRDPAPTPTVELSAEPTHGIGGGEDPLFNLYNVVDALAMPNGELAVANAGYDEILIFDDAGQLARRLGRSGSGPGEFSALQWLDFVGQAFLAAGDARQRRIAVFDSTGTLSRSIAIANSVAEQNEVGTFAPVPVGSFGDGSIAVASHGPLPRVEGSHRRLMTVIRYMPDTEKSVTIGAWPGDELYLLSSSGRLQVLTPPFARRTVVQIGTSSIFVGDSERPEVHVVALDGALHTIVRWTREKRSVNEGMLDAVSRHKYANMTDGPALERRLVEQKSMAIHETTPAFESMHSVGDETVWIADYTLPADSLVVWLGVHIAQATVDYVVLPKRFEPLAFGRNDVTVLMRDELGVERIERYELVRQ